LKQYCLRALGEPVIQVNVDVKQLEDRIDEALEYFKEYHFDGVEKLYYSHAITATDITNKYIDLPDSIISVSNIMRVGNNAYNMFDIKYQFSLQYTANLRNLDMITYDMLQRHLQLIEEIFQPMPFIRFNRIQNRLYVDTNWSEVSEGDYYVVQCQGALDPATWPGVYGNRWLRKYLIELIRRQWGENLSKFDGIELPGGIKLDGGKIKDLADRNLKELEEQIRREFQEPVDFIVG